MHEHKYDFTDEGGPIQTWTVADDVLGEGCGTEFLVEASEFEGEPTVTLNIGDLLMIGARLSHDHDGPHVVDIAQGAVNIELSPAEAVWLGLQLIASAGATYKPVIFLSPDKVHS